MTTVTRDLAQRGFNVMVAGIQLVKNKTTTLCANEDSFHSWKSYTVD